MTARIRLALQWLLNAVALLLLPEVITGLRVDSYAAALVTALLLALINTLIRPILIFVTLPITLLTLGLFTLVINALLFWGVSALVSGVHVPDFWTAFWSALLYSVLTWFVGIALAGGDERQLHIAAGRRRD